MKRKLFYSLVVLMFIFALTACKNKKGENISINLKKGAFSITCNTKYYDIGGINQKIESTYNFNDDQYAINYAVVTTQNFKDKSLYKTYKEAQQETVKDSTDDISYELKTNDKNKTLIFAMSFNNIDVNDAQTEEEKERLKAKSILESVEKETDPKYNCKLEGISRSKLN